MPNSCGIITPTDTFPHRYLVKIDSMGYWDSSFKKDANHAVQGFVPYDSNRLFVQGLSRAFTHYDGVRVNGLCRIYEDGSLDTTFQLLQTTNFGNFTLPVDVQEDGSFFLYGGGYSLMNYPNIQFKIAKFHADGSLDTSFRSHHNLKDISGGSTQINSLVSTLDGGYIITGMFDSIQGYAKHNLAKLDSLGNVEPQYFTTHGPDTSHWQGGGYEYVKIKKSVFGGYYVYGDFISWDGKAVQPIVRLKDLTVGIPKQKHKKLEAAIYPNPSKGQVKVVAKVKLQGIAVYNLQGQLVQQINPKKRSWELPDKSGMYLIRITDENGNYFTEKIIKN